MAEAFRPDGRLNIPTQAAADYIAEQGQLVPYEPTMREKTQRAIANFLRDYGGLSNFDSYNMAEGVTGSTRPDARNPMGIGLMDFTPAGVVFSSQEAARDFDKAESPTDYIAPTVGLGLSAVEAFPLTKAITKPAAAFLSNLGRKTAGQEAVDLSRRDFAKKLSFGVAAAPAVAVGAGALSKLPVEKAVKLDIPFKEPDIPPRVDITQFDRIEPIIDDLVSIWRKSNPGKDADDYVPDMNDIDDYMQDSGAIEYLRGNQSITKVGKKARDFIRQMESSGMDSSMMLKELGF